MLQAPRLPRFHPDDQILRTDVEIVYAPDRMACEIDSSPFGVADGIGIGTSTGPRPQAGRNNWSPESGRHRFRIRAAADVSHAYEYQTFYPWPIDALELSTEPDAICQ